MAKQTAIIALEDGTVYQGQAFGALGTRCGEVCFNTSMTGYQEILTDPSYKAQIVAMTYPLIGNYGINREDIESWRPHVSGFVIRELSKVVSNWRSEWTLSEYLKKYDIPGIHGIDTRALTKRIRVHGALKGCLSTDPEMTKEEAVERARSWGGLVGKDYVKEVSHSEAFDWDPQDQISHNFSLVKGASSGPSKNHRDQLPVADLPIVAIDFGIKYNILRRLRQYGFKIKIVPASASYDEIMELGPRGIFLSNGPGDPAAITYGVETVARLLLDDIPIFGICFGHQILSLAMGGETYKLKFGHRGGNQPVKDLGTGRVEITSQNHGFAVDFKSLPQDVEVDKINLNDQTVEGLRHKTKPVFSVQYHPEASPGPHDSTHLFAAFRKMVEQNP